MQYVITGVAVGYYMALISTFRLDYKNEMEILVMKLFRFILRGARRLIVYYAQFPFLQVVSDCIFFSSLSSCSKLSRYSMVLFSVVQLVEPEAVSL